MNRIEYQVLQTEEKIMKGFIYSLTIAALILLPISVTAQWSWEEDYSFHNPGLDREVIEKLPFVPFSWNQYRYAFLTDLSGDGFPEYVIFNGTIHVLEAKGEFPNTVWHYRDGFFDTAQIPINVYPLLYDLDGDASAELIYLTYNHRYHYFNVLKNLGTFHEPKWLVWENNPLTELELNRSGIAAIIDYDHDSLLDVLFGTGEGFDRYEVNEEGEWEELDPIYFPNAWLRPMTQYLADMDSDGDYDVVYNTLAGSGQTAGGAVLINNGNSDSAMFSDPIMNLELDFYDLTPGDLNGDGLTDLVGQYSYKINTSLGDRVSFDRMESWSIYTDYNADLADCVDDQRPEVVRLDYESYNHGRGGLSSAQHKVVKQLQRTSHGWKDTRFLGSDFDERVYRAKGQVNIVGYFDNGNPDVSIFQLYDDDNNPEPLRLHKKTHVDNFEFWMYIPEFFDAVMDVANPKRFSFADLDKNGDMDLIRLDYTNIYRPDSMGITFFEFSWDGDNHGFTEREDWRTGLENAFFNKVECADFDNDGTLELVGLMPTQPRNRHVYKPVMYKNVGVDNIDWQLVEDAFTDCIPDTLKFLDVGFVDEDDLPDIIVENRVYLNRLPDKVSDNILTPQLFSLSAFPNPFNSSTTIEYRVGANSNSPVTLSLYDLSGRLVQTLVNERLTPGNYRTTLNANGLASGVYALKLDGYTPLDKGGWGGLSKKIVVVK